MSIFVLHRLSVFAVLLFLVNSLAAAEPQVLIPSATDSAATWRYTTDKPDADWTKPDFDDGSGPRARPGLASPITSRRRPPSVPLGQRPTSGSARRSDVPDPLEFTSAGLIVRHDEDVECLRRRHPGLLGPRLQHASGPPTM